MGIKENFGNPKGLIGSFMLIGMNRGHTPMAKWAFTQFDVPEKGNILDVGCGGGFNIKRLIEKSSEGMVYGIDISDTSVKKSKSVNKKYMDKRCKIYKGSVEQLPFEDDFAELVTAFETVYFWKDMKKSFLEVKRILKNQGRFVVVNDPGNPDRHWDDMIPDMISWKPEDIEGFMKDAGFSDVKVTRSQFKFCVTGTKII